MSLFDRRTLLTLIAAGAVAGCGFTPVYGPGGNANALQGQVEVAAPETRLDFALVARLEERLGRAASPVYTLTYATNVSTAGLAITDADDITRINLNGTLNYRLIDRATDTVTLRGSVSSFTAYSTTGSPVATRAAERDAEDRLMIILADQVVSQLLARAPTTP